MMCMFIGPNFDIEINPLFYWSYNVFLYNMFELLYIFYLQIEQMHLDSDLWVLDVIFSLIYLLS